MSQRELLRIVIRMAAPPAVIFYIFYRFYQKSKDHPLIKKTVETWHKLWVKVTKKPVEAIEESELS